MATPDDVACAETAARIIEQASSQHDIARRAPELLREKIRTGRAAVAFATDELVGFGYWSEWQDGRFVSHSGLVVRPEHRGRGVARRLKLALFEASRLRFPRATLMSLTNSPEVKALNLSLGFRVVPLTELTADPAFWAGCVTCRNYAEIQANGERCCCEGMTRTPEAAP